MNTVYTAVRRQYTVETFKKNLRVCERQYTLMCPGETTNVILAASA